MINLCKNYLDVRGDYGLRFFAVMIFLYNCALFLISAFFFKPQMLALLPSLLAILFLFVHGQAAKVSGVKQLLSNAILVYATVALNYVVIGLMDSSIGGLPRMDTICAEFDFLLYNIPVALIVEKWVLLLLGSYQFLFYDFLLTIYFVYFIFPMIGMFLVYRYYVETSEGWQIFSYLFSFIVSYMINMVLYLAIPVTGPQYFLKDSFSSPLLLSPYGQFLFDNIKSGQQTLIDCFPSGHVWITVLATIWLFNINHKFKYLGLFITFSMIFATLGLRFHYTLDLLVAIPMAFIVFGGTLKFSKWWVG